MGTKAHDLFVIPLCRAHHDELHRDPKLFESNYGSQIELLFRFLDHAIAVGVIGTDIKNKVCGGDLICVTFNWFLERWGGWAACEGTQVGWIQQAHVYYTAVKEHQ